MTMLQFKCYGRTRPAQAALATPVDVVLCINQHDASFHLNVNCPHNAGGHGDWCKADPANHHVPCPYSIDIPYHFDQEVLVGTVVGVKRG